WDEDPKSSVRQERRYASVVDRTDRRRPPALRDSGAQRADPSLWRKDCLDHSRRQSTVGSDPRRSRAKQLFTRIGLGLPAGSVHSSREPDFVSVVLDRQADLPVSEDAELAIQEFRKVRDRNVWANGIGA